MDHQTETDMERAYRESQEKVQEARALKKAIKDYTLKHHAGGKRFQAQAFDVIVLLDRDAEAAQALFN